MVARRVLVVWLALICVSIWGCGDENMIRLSGSLRARVQDADREALEVAVALRTSIGLRQVEDVAARPETVLEVHGLPPGTWEVDVIALGAEREPLRRVTVPDVVIRAGETTEIVVYLGSDPGPCDPDSRRELPLCMACNQAGELVAADDDDLCGPIPCDAFGWFELQGDNGAAGESACIQGIARDITDHRCAGPGRCVVASSALCPIEEETIANAGPCRFIEGCEAGAPAVGLYPDGMPCGVGRVCAGGECVETADNPVDDPVDEVGCADGTREGFVSLEDHPAIAGCSGGWSIGGITRPDLAPACGRQSGNDSLNPEGTGCSAADLCAPGWHVCRGKDEVAALSPDGCAGAVPPGTPDKTLFFAVAQHSRADSVCDESGEGNDVFGCGNLGAVLSPDKDCWPLDRVLASMHAGTCGFNEAEPPLGPWMCVGGEDSHLQEGALVRKNGCPAASCSYDGEPVANADKGGVLCCMD